MISTFQRDIAKRVPVDGVVELAATTNFSFLRGASHPEEMVVQAAKLGLSGLCVCDRNSLAGVVRAHMAAKEASLPFHPGCRLVFADKTPDILVWPVNREGYANLCELLTCGKRRAPKGECELYLDDLLARHDNLLMAVIPPHDLVQDAEHVGTLSVALGTMSATLGATGRDRFHLAINRFYDSRDQRRMAKIIKLANKNEVPLIAIGDVLYHRAERRHLQDVLTCIREHVTLASAGTRLHANAERHLRSPQATAVLFKECPEAISNAAKLFNRLYFSLDELRYQYPEEPTGSHLPPQETLEKLVEKGLQERYPLQTHSDGPPAKVLKSVRHELDLIGRLQYAPYFLTVYDIVRFARSRNILCQGRGSAANSAVCYCIGITAVDPDKVDLLFERFISEERGEPPDIDVDFEHERREEVIQYIYQKYGRERAGLAATVITYRAKSAIREAAKAFGYSEDTINAISNTKWGSWSREVELEDARRGGLDPNDKHLRQMIDLAQQLVGFPRHLSQHVGGFVITRDRLSSLIPIENAAMEDRTIVEWDKDDLESLGMLKIDVLALGMLTCIRKAFDLLDRHYNRSLTLATIPDEDPQTYDMICRADTVGVFQIESRAQMSMLPRLKPRTYYDLVIEVAIVRPGPIQGDMVHPYLRRRQGKEPVTFPKQELKEVLGKTLGVPLFQEQAMNIAIVAARFSPGEADKLRRAMATFRRVGTIHSFQMKMVEGMVKNGYDRDFAEHCFKQIEGFGDYGFPESHAASFALLVYVSCWLKCHYPDVFCAAMLNSQPMGFYAPAQLVRDAREHGVEVRPVDVNHSHWLSTLEADGKVQHVSPRHQSMKGIMKNTHAVRLGLHQVKGFGEADAMAMIENRGEGYDSVRDLWVRSGLTRRAIEKLAEADCFGSIGLSRRDALWAVKALDPLSSSERLPLFAHVDQAQLQKEAEVHLPPMLPGEEVIHDYRALSLSLKAHPVSFVRSTLVADRFVTNLALDTIPSGRRVRVAGLVLVRQRPGTAKGVVFETIEDETGVANIIVWPKTFEKFRQIVLGSRFVAVSGKLQSHDGVIHVVADRLEDLTPLLGEVAEGELVAEMGESGSGRYSALAKPDPIGNSGLANADEVRRPAEDIREKIKPASRLARLLKDAPELKQDFVELSHHKTRNRFRPKHPKNQEQLPLKRALPKGRNFH